MEKTLIQEKIEKIVTDGSGYERLPSKCTAGDFSDQLSAITNNIYFLKQSCFGSLHDCKKVDSDTELYIRGRRLFGKDE